MILLWPCSLLCSLFAMAEQPTQQAGLDAREGAATFTTRSDLVLVPVVVRDKRGRPLDNLTKDDFELFDRGKPQAITTIAAVREAAKQYLDNGQQPYDRAAVYTFSGRLNVEFTSDRKVLMDAIAKLKVRQTFGHGETECPRINYYFADLIVNGRDLQALQALALHTWHALA